MLGLIPSSVVGLAVGVVDSLVTIGAVEVEIVTLGRPLDFSI